MTYLTKITGCSVCSNISKYKVIPTVMQFSSKALLISLKINKRRFCRQVETDNFQHHMAEVTNSVNATNHLHPRNASKLE